MRRITLGMIAAAFVVAACGGGGLDATTTTAASITAATSPTTTATSPTTTTAAPTTTTAAPTTTTAAEATTTTSGATTGGTINIFAENFSFSPSVVTIKVGDTVMWNLSSGTHTTTSGSGAPDGRWDQVITEETPVSITFDEAGEFPFYCRFHGDFMSGKVVVEP